MSETTCAGGQGESGSLLVKLAILSFANTTWTVHGHLSGRPKEQPLHHSRTFRCYYRGADRETICRLGRGTASGDSRGCQPLRCPNLVRT